MPVAVTASVQEAVLFFASAQDHPKRIKTEGKEWVEVLEAAVRPPPPPEATSADAGTSSRGEQQLAESLGLSGEHIDTLISAIIAYKQKNDQDKAEADSASKKKKKRKKRFRFQNVPVKSETVNTFGETAFGLSITLSSRLISSLVPRDRIECDSVQTILLWTISNCGALSLRGLSEPILKWISLLLHYHVIPVKGLQTIYEALIQALATCHSSLRPILYDLVYKVTVNEKSLVTGWRARALLKLRRSEGVSPPLETLLLKYQELRPDLVKDKLMRKIAASATSGITKVKSLEAGFEVVWAGRSEDMTSVADDFGLDVPLRIWGSGPQTSAFADQSNKRTRKCVVPPHDDCDVLTYSNRLKRRRLSGSYYDDGIGDDVSLQECKSLSDMVKCIRKLRPPNQAISLLGNPQTYIFLLLNPKSKELRERLSMSLYYTLHNEFFSMTASSGCTQRKLDLLCRINLLQGWLQQGLPVVGKFLVQYLENWNGRDFFVEILKMVANLQITDFDELNDCILSPIRSLFTSTFKPGEQLVTLHSLSKLVLHWTTIEYERLKTNQSGTFLTADTWCENPIGNIASLVEVIQQLADTGLCSIAMKKRRKSMNPQKHNFYTNIYVNEVLNMFTVMARCFIAKEVPVRPELPDAVVYHSLFSNNTTFLSRTLEYIAMAKHEMLPVCERLAIELDAEGDMGGKKVASEAADNVMRLNSVTKDCLSVLATEVFLRKGQSLFRQDWHVEEDDITENLTFMKHPAFLPYTTKYVKDYSGKTGVDHDEAYQQLCDEKPEAIRGYVTLLNEKLPRIMEFLWTFKPKLKPIEPEEDDDTENFTGGNADKSMDTASQSTSGIGSMASTVRTRSSFGKK